jgi:two-component system chemotaxis sensor kinase CheA
LRPEKIRAKAIAKGIITEADAEKMTQQQIYQLIWEPGFSTAEKVTEVSGRGMGMDIVRTKIEELNGTVELDSTPGEGTVFTIRLPLTMAILPSLLAQIDGDVFAVPVESVVEIIRVPRTELSTVHGMPTVQVRDRVVSVVSLVELFSWNQAALAADAGDGPDVTLVIMGSDGSEAGLVVHGLIGEQDIVIKSLSENYQNVEGVAGASILGDGRVALILDVAALMEIACRPRLRSDDTGISSSRLRELLA